MASDYLLPYREHYDAAIQADEAAQLAEPSYEYKFMGREEASCFELTKDEDNQYQLQTSYYIGIDWLEKQKTALYIAPKLNYHSTAPSIEIDYIEMMFQCLQHAEVAQHVDDLAIIKWDEPPIKVTQQQDLLTPLLVIEYLSVLKQIVKKGLKKSYYRVTKNLHHKIKGKLLVEKTIKKQLQTHQLGNAFCRYDEYGLNSAENRLLKKALMFIKRFLPNYSQAKSIQNLFNFIRPAFEQISDAVEKRELNHAPRATFYQEYDHALRLAKLILKKFGYKLSNVGQHIIHTPPFWIDMSKLFELYVLGLLKDRFGQQLHYQFKVGKGNELDYLLDADEYQLVIDAKYKSKYQHGLIHEDMRQVSGYARLTKVHERFGIAYPDSVNCLIIYPDQQHGASDLMKADLLANPIKGYQGIYKVAVKLPIIGEI